MSNRATGRHPRRFVWVIIPLVLLGGILSLVDFTSMGGDVSGARLQRAEASPHYRNGAFVNVVPESSADFGLYWDYLVEQLFGDQIRVPPKAIPVLAVSTGPLDEPPEAGLRAIWLGHASVYLELDGVRLLVDPLFSDRPSPVRFIGPTRFHPTPIALTALPKIDAVVISHDHYDHLDMPTIQFLSARGTQFFVPLGVGAHLEKWNVPASQIQELAWGEHEGILGITIVSTPTRHYSGRGLFDANETFWSSWSIIGPRHRVFYSGDTGFSDHFAEIGREFGPFDLSIIKIGAYGPDASWFDIHMDPEHAIEAHIAVQARRMLPVHWATLNLAFHDWDEPIERAVQAANDRGVDLVTPRIGEVVTAGETFESLRWWEAVR